MKNMKRIYYRLLEIYYDMLLTYYCKLHIDNKISRRTFLRMYEPTYHKYIDIRTKLYGDMTFVFHLPKQTE